MNLMRQLWQDEAGVIVSTEIILVLMILVFGLLAGMVALRDGVAQELADAGQMVNSLNQSYNFQGHTFTTEADMTVTCSTPSSLFADLEDDNNDDVINAPADGLDVSGVAGDSDAT